MGRQEEILMKLHPGRTEFSDMEREFADELLRIASGKSEKANALPSRYIEIGGRVEIRGRWYECVVRPSCHWLDSCSGCAFFGCDCPPFLQCSRHDRRDGRYVWFKPCVDE